jgi:hypothetical protein
MAIVVPGSTNDVSGRETMSVKSMSLLSVLDVHRPILQLAGVTPLGCL